jgi:hypothetical protein
MANPPSDRGQEVMDVMTGLVPGETYYYYFGDRPEVETRSTGQQAYQKLRVTRVARMSQHEYIVHGIDEEGKPRMKPWRSDRDYLNHFFRIDPRPVQRSVGELFATKLPGLSSAPGTGPANTVRKMLGVQPRPSATGGGRRRSRRHHKKRRATRRR